VRHSFLNAHLSKDLRKKYGKRSLPLRKGDEVLVMQGSFAKKKAKITSVDLKKGRVALEGIQHSKKDGSKVHVFFSAHKLMIQSLTLDDKERAKILKEIPKKEVKKEIKPETQK
jgi:large subunit ribosomal protein L24